MNQMGKNSKTFTKRDLLIFISGFILMNGMSHAWLAYKNITFSFTFYTLNTTGNWITAAVSMIAVIVLVWWATRTKDKEEGGDTTRA